VRDSGHLYATALAALKLPFAIGARLAMHLRGIGLARRISQD
jgi:hypothetical protein